MVIVVRTDSNRNLHHSLIGLGKYYPHPALSFYVFCGFLWFNRCTNRVFRPALSLVFPALLRYPLPHPSGTGIFK